MCAHKESHFSISSLTLLQGGCKSKNQSLQILMKYTFFCSKWKITLEKGQISIWVPRGTLATTRAHCSKGGAKVKINVFKFWLNIHSPVPNEGIHWKRSKIEVCIALNLRVEKIHFWVLLIKFDPSSENQLF